MAGKWTSVVLASAMVTTFLNLAMIISQVSTPVSARGTGPSKWFDDEDFTDGLTKVIRKTVRDYCTVGKRNGIDC